MTSILDRKKRKDAFSERPDGSFSNRLEGKASFRKDRQRVVAELKNHYIPVPRIDI